MKHKKTVAVDLDGVLAQYDRWQGVDHIGDPIPGSREFLQQLRDMGLSICIHTTRANVGVNQSHSEVDLIFRIKSWLGKHEMTFDFVSGHKPLAIAYVDDRALLCRPQTEISDFARAIARIETMLRLSELRKQGAFCDSTDYLDEDDENELKLAVMSGDGLVRIEFGKPTAMIGMTSKQARDFAALILKHANR